MEHGHQCSHCYYLGEDHCGHDHFISHKQPEYPVLVRVGSEYDEPDEHVTALQTYLHARPCSIRREGWAMSVIAVHEWAMLQLENMMGCRIGQSSPKYVQW